MFTSEISECSKSGESGCLLADWDPFNIKLRSILSYLRGSILPAPAPFDKDNAVCSGVSLNMSPCLQLNSVITSASPELICIEMTVMEACFLCTSIRDRVNICVSMTVVSALDCVYQGLSTQTS